MMRGMIWNGSRRVRGEMCGYNSATCLSLPPCREMVEQLVDFGRAVATREYQEGATPWEGRRVQAVVDAIYAASEQNAPVVLGSGH